MPRSVTLLNNWTASNFFSPPNILKEYPALYVLCYGRSNIPFYPGQTGSFPTRPYGHYLGGLQWWSCPRDFQNATAIEYFHNLGVPVSVRSTRCVADKKLREAGEERIKLGLQLTGGYHLLQDLGSYDPKKAKRTVEIAKVHRFCDMLLREQGD